MSDFTTGGRATVRDVLVDAERRLDRAGIPSPSVDASELVAFALGTTRTRLFLHDRLDPDQRVRVEQLITQRLNRVPLQHITGTAAFRRLVVSVGPGVFIPRPETELVAEAAIRALGEIPEGKRVAIDLCSGSGVIALALATEVPQSRVIAVEIDDVAIGWTRANVTAHRAQIDAAGSSVEVVHEDAVLASQQSLVSERGRCAVVVCNPPYIPVGMVPRDPEVRDHEPRIALYGGEDGMDLVRGILTTAGDLLCPGGRLVIEHADVQGPAGSQGGVPGLVSDARDTDGRPLFRDVVDRTDFNGRPRFTVATRI
jgi:release factor glutamine methyltransferase